jgi:hypothetical protein
MRVLWFAAIAGCFCLPALAQVYKWVDEKGVTQYGERPPADNKAQKMKMADPSPPGTAGADASRDANARLREQEAGFKKRQAAREADEAKGFKDATLQRCAALAREMVDSDARVFPKEQMAKIEAMCPANGFICTSVRARPAENKCEPVPLKDGKTFVRNNWKAG